VLLLAIVWGWHTESALYEGHGVNVPTSLHGYNVFITGSTSGIGFEAALEFYGLGAHVLIHSSDAKRAAKSAAEVRSLSARKGQRLGTATPLAGNLANFNDLRRFAREVPKVMPRIDIYIMNAARMYGLGAQYKDNSKLMGQPDSVFQSPSGHDTVQAVNHMGHYLLTELILPRLAHGAIIVIVSAMGGWDGNHRRIMPPWGNFGKHIFNKKTSTPKRIKWEVPGLKEYAFTAYHDSKYMNFCYAYWLRRRISNATIHVHDPGYVMTTPMMDRNSKAYKERLNRGYRQKKIWMWHAPSFEAGRHILENVFVTRHPVPEVVTSYFMPRQVVSWFAPMSMEARGRSRWVSKWQNWQRLLWGLHASIGPECDIALQDRFMRWTAEQVAPR